MPIFEITNNLLQNYKKLNLHITNFILLDKPNNNYFSLFLSLVHQEID